MYENNWIHDLQFYVLHALLAWLLAILFCSIFLMLYQEIDNDGYIYMGINDMNIPAGKEQKKTSYSVTTLAYLVQLPQY
jgi:hypothetical protein